MIPIRGDLLVSRFQKYTMKMGWVEFQKNIKIFKTYIYPHGEEKTPNSFVCFSDSIYYFKSQRVIYIVYVSCCWKLCVFREMRYLIFFCSDLKIKLPILLRILKLHENTRSQNESQKILRYSISTPAADAGCFENIKSTNQVAWICSHWL